MTAPIAPPIALGINLSFAVKRWVTAGAWAALVRDRLGLDLVQFSFDIVDPGWPVAVTDREADAIRKESARAGITVHSAFVGLAHYTFNQLLHPDPAARDHAEAWLCRAYAFAARAGITRVGGPLGAIAATADGAESADIPAADYRDLIHRMHRLAERARAEGLTELYVEPTPLRREWPWRVDQAQQMMADLGDCAVPWRFCLDWGHGTYQPLYGAGATDMDAWLTGLALHTTALHIQQTDFQGDRHWDFTAAEGRVDPARAAKSIRDAGLGELPVFLEVFYPFERDSASILAALDTTIPLLKRAFA